MEDKYLNGAGIITLYYKLCEKFFPQTGSYIKKLEDGTTKTIYPSLTIGSTSTNSELKIYGTTTSTGAITASKFIRSDKSIGFLKGDGSVDTNSYAKSTHTHTLSDLKGTVVTNVYTTDGILCVSKLANNQGSSDTLDDLHSATTNKLSTARTISLTGGVSGSGTFDGSSDISIKTTLQSHTHSYLPLSGGTLTGVLTIGSTSANKDLNVYGSIGCYGSTTNNRIHFYTATTDNSSLGFVNGNKYIQVGDVTNSKYTTITPSQITSTNIDLNGTIKSTGFVHKGASDVDNIVLTNGSHVSKSDIVVGSANKLSTSRTISLTGSVTGSGTFDGSSNLSISTTTHHDHTFASLTSKPNILTSLSINPSSYRLQYTKYNSSTQTSLVAPDGSTTKYCSDFLECPTDKRATAEAPQDYVKGLHVQFKDNSTLNTNSKDTIGNDGDYAGLITLRPFGKSGDTSGGVMQLAMTTGNNLWFRARSSATTWQNWKKYATTADTVNAANRVYQYTYTSNTAGLEKKPILTSYATIDGTFGTTYGVISNTDLYTYKGSIICKNSSIETTDTDYSSRLITWAEMTNYVKAQIGGFIPNPTNDDGSSTETASTMSLRAAAPKAISEESIEETPRVVLYKKFSNRKDKSYSLRLEGAQWWIDNGYVPVFFRKAKKHNKSHSNPGLRRVGYIWCDIDSNSNLIIYPDKSYYDFCGLTLNESMSSFTKDLNLGHLLCPSKLTGEYRKIRWGSNSPLYKLGKKLEFKFKLGFVPRTLFTSEGLIDGSYDHTKVRTNFYQIGIEDVKSNLIDIVITASGTSNETWFNQRSVDVVGF